MPSAPKDLKPNAAGCAERKTFRAVDFFSSLLKERRLSKSGRGRTSVARQAVDPAAAVDFLEGHFEPEFPFERAGESASDRVRLPSPCDASSRRSGCASNVQPQDQSLIGHKVHLAEEGGFHSAVRDNAFRPNTPLCCTQSVWL
jgi:hypothetical protein